MPVLRRLVSGLLLALTLAVLGGSGRAHAQYPDPDRFTLQVSTRLINGFGFSRGIPHSGLLGDTGIRTDFLFGRPGDEHFRIGPAIDFRSACTLPILVACIHPQTIEGGLGGTLLIPFRRGYPITITPAVGYAFRRDAFGGDGFYLSNTFAWGYRPYNFFHKYGYGIEAFASHRLHLDDPSAWELTFGIEMDFELLVWVPILFVKMALTHEHPGEPYSDEDPSDPVVRDVGGASSGQPTPAAEPTPLSEPAPSAEPTPPTAPATP